MAHDFIGHLDRVTTEELEEKAGALYQEAARLEAAGETQRASRWKDWARRADKNIGRARLRTFVAEEAEPPLQGIQRTEGTYTVDPREWRRSS